MRAALPHQVERRLVLAQRPPLMNARIQHAVDGFGGHIDWCGSDSPIRGNQTDWQQILLFTHQIQPHGVVHQGDNANQNQSFSIEKFISDACAASLGAVEN